MILEIIPTETIIWIFVWYVAFMYIPPFKWITRFSLACMASHLTNLINKKDNSNEKINCKTVSKND